MAFLPESPWALLTLAGLVAALVAIVSVRTIPKAYGFAVACFAVFLVDTAEAVFVGSRTVAEQLGFSTHEFTRGAWWTPVSYMFVHADFRHILGNLFILLSAGPLIEDRLGGWGFVAIFGLAGLAAAGSHTLVGLAGLVPLSSLAVGASGAIFGVLTVLAFHWPREKVPIFIVFVMLWWPAWIVLMVFIGFNVAYAVGTPGIAWYGHYAGIFVGTLAAPAVKRWVTTGPRRFPDPEALVPLATTPALHEILQRLRETSGTAKDDPHFADLWLDRFFAKARCPAGHPLARDGLTARCAAGEYQLAFGR